MAGLSGLIGVGRRQKEQALGGLGIAAQQETARNVANEQLDAQRKAATMNVVGTAGGIAGAQALVSSGAKKALAQNIANQQIAAGIANTTGAVTQASQMAIATQAGGTTAAAAGGTAAASGGASAALMAAAPWAALIIGGGYLLKKLFD